MLRSLSAQTTAQMYFSSTLTLFTQAKTTVPCESRNGLWYNWPRSPIHRADCIWQAAVNNFVRKCTADVAFRSISVRSDFTSSQVHATCNYFIHDKTTNVHLRICMNGSSSNSSRTMFVLYDAMHVHLIFIFYAHTHVPSWANGNRYANYSDKFRQFRWLARNLRLLPKFYPHGIRYTPKIFRYSKRNSEWKRFILLLLYFYFY